MDSATATALAAELEKAIASGVLTVRHGDTMTTFRSLDEMQRILDGLQQQAGTTRTRVRYVWQTSRGY